MEVEKAKAKVLRDLISEMGKIHRLASKTVWGVSVASNPDFFETYREGTKHVAADDVRPVGKKDFYDDALTVAVVRLQGLRLTEEKAVSSERTEIGKVALPNGMRVLLKEGHSVPSVHFASCLTCRSFLEN